MLWLRALCWDHSFPMPTAIVSFSAPTRYVSATGSRVQSCPVVRVTFRRSRKSRPGRRGPLRHGKVVRVENRSSSPWQKGIIVNRGSRVRIEVSAGRHTTNSADQGVLGPMLAS